MLNELSSPSDSWSDEHDVLTTTAQGLTRIEAIFLILPTQDNIGAENTVDE